MVLFISALRAWTTHESLWVLVGFGHYEKRTHAIEKIGSTSLGQRLHGDELELSRLKNGSAEGGGSRRSASDFMMHPFCPGWKNHPRLKESF
jgi:hypothetical protein